MPIPRSYLVFAIDEAILGELERCKIWLIDLKKKKHISTFGYWQLSDETEK